MEKKYVVVKHGKTGKIRVVHSSKWTNKQKALGWGALGWLVAGPVGAVAGYYYRKHRGSR